MSLPPCPVCGETARYSGGGLNSKPPVAVEHGHCPLHDLAGKRHRLRDSDWLMLSRILAAGLRATGRAVHDNYLNWEKENG